MRKFKRYAQLILILFIGLLSSCSKQFKVKPLFESFLYNASCALNYWSLELYKDKPYKYEIK